MSQKFQLIVVTDWRPEKQSGITKMGNVIYFPKEILNENFHGKLRKWNKKWKNVIINTDMKCGVITRFCHQFLYQRKISFYDHIYMRQDIKFCESLTFQIIL